MADWIAARAGLPFYGEQTEPYDVAETLFGIERVTTEFADVMRESGKSIADGQISNAEARRMIRELQQLIAAATPLLAGLQAIRDSKKC